RRTRLRERSVRGSRGSSKEMKMTDVVAPLAKDVRLSERVRITPDGTDTAMVAEFTCEVRCGSDTCVGHERMVNVALDELVVQKLIGNLVGTRFGEKLEASFNVIRSALMGIMDIADERLGEAQAKTFRIEIINAIDKFVQEVEALRS